MSLFIDPPNATKIATSPTHQIEPMAAAATAVFMTGFVSLVGFFIAPVLGIVALRRIKRNRYRGRALAHTAIWGSIATLLIGVLIVLILLIVAYTNLPAPLAAF